MYPVPKSMREKPMRKMKKAKRLYNVMSDNWRTKPPIPMTVNLG